MPVSGLGAAGSSRLKAPLFGSAVVVCVAPEGSVMVTVLPGSAVPETVGMPSPSVSRTVTPVGAAGAVRSVLSTLVLGPVLPAASVALAL